MSWYGSRAVGCPIGREITARTVFSSWKRFKRRNTPRFRRFFSEKRLWKRFATNVLIRGKWIQSTANWWEQSCTGSNAAPEKSLQKNLSRKIAPFLVSKISPATGVRVFDYVLLSLCATGPVRDSVSCFVFIVKFILNDLDGKKNIQLLNLFLSMHNPH